MLPARQPEYNPRARAEKADDPAVGISLLAWGAPLSGAVSVFQISHRRKVGARFSILTFQLPTPDLTELMP
jgi:hypothetical protein